MSRTDKLEVALIPPKKHTRDPTNGLYRKLDGVVPRVEDRPNQIEIARTAGFDTVMIDTYRAERLLEGGDTADALFPGTTVVLTTTFEDERLEKWILEREIDVATQFGADAVIPCDMPVYSDDPRQQRLQDLRVYADNIRRAATRFSEHGIAVIPLVKGETEYERQICYDTFAQIGLNYVAFYCAQFFLYGPRYQDLLTRVRNIVREFDPRGMMLVGFQSENLLPEFPPTVQSAAGFRWFWKSGLSSEPVTVAQRNYVEWERKTRAALQTGQALLDSFTSQPTYGGL